MQDGAQRVRPLGPSTLADLVYFSSTSEWTRFSTTELMSYGNCSLKRLTSVVMVWFMNGRI